ncbi:MAG: potassium channel family protein [Candidatus Omnitrophica bacterium]|nr:potassium channel family protein [Candidatus Omnitrophota bacterium]
MFARWLLLKVRSKNNLPLPILVVVEFILYLLIISALFVLGIKVTENISWVEAVWQVWQTETTIGYGNAPAQTTAGRILTMLFGIMGMACLGVVISHAVDLKQYIADQRRLGMLKNPYKDGYVIFNYPGENFELFVHELVSREPDVGICIIDSNMTELSPTLLAKHNKIHFIHGYSHEKRTYEQAALQDNKCVLIFPADACTPESDLATSRLVDLVLRFAGQDAQVIYILVEPKNQWMFSKKAIGIIQNLELLAAVQECQDAHSSSVVQHILTNSEGPNTQTISPAQLVGWTWGEFVKTALDISGRLNIPFNALAHIRGETINTSPLPDQKIEAGDQLSVIAEKSFDWPTFEKEFVKMYSNQE